MKEAFEAIYEKQAWGKDKGSGTGSSPQYCVDYLAYLRTIVGNYKYVIDLGCGDWQLYTGFRWPSTVHYVGIDIVAKRVDVNKILYGGDTVRFSACDFSQPYYMRLLCANYPRALILVKDVLQHWSDDEIAGWLEATAPLNWRTILAVNNWKHFRSPAKNGTPRDINNAYRWAPIDMRQHGFTEVMYYPAKGKFKQVTRIDK
jgi:SAM-dependent methyltransferase